MSELDNKEYFMFTESDRLKSYKKWPFKKGCTPKKMAAAGFYHCPTSEEPDAVRCFMCFKELDGWEENDDPWNEHKKHSPSCSFLSMNKPLEEFTLEEFLNLQRDIQKNRLNKQFDRLTNELEDLSESTRSELCKLTNVS